MAIGTLTTNAVTIFRQHGLAPFRTILTGALFGTDPAAVWPKQMVLIPEVIFWLMASVALGGGAMAAAVTLFSAPLRGLYPWLPIQAVTEEAFCTARKWLPLRFFRHLFNRLVAAFDAQFPGRFRWRGFRLLGIDGMDNDLPSCEALRLLYPPPSNQHGARRQPQGRLVALVDLWTGVCRAFRLVPLKYSEQRCASILLGLLGPGDLLLADRNFPGIAVMARIVTRGAHFLIHLPSNRFLKLPRRRTPSRKRHEWYATLALSKAQRKPFPQLLGGLAVRIIQYQRPGFRPSWLITSLRDTALFTYDDLVELYHQRWRQETAHREWKYTLQLSNLRSHTNDGIVKEVLVQLTLNNAIRWTMADAAATEQRPVDLQFLAAKRLIFAEIQAMAVAPPEQLATMYRQLCQAIAHHVILVRPGRSYPRKFDRTGRPKGHGKVAPAARMDSKIKIR